MPVPTSDSQSNHHTLVNTEQSIEDADLEDIGQLLKELDEAELTMQGVEDKLDGMMVNLDQLLETLETEIQGNTSKDPASGSKHQAGGDSETSGDSK
jgi:hypothetical protein